MTSLSVAGKIALVTGAAEGIGWASSSLLAERGAHVVLVGRSADGRLESRRDDLLIRDLSAECVVSDVTDSASVAALYKSVFKSHKRLDILVANAGSLGDARLGMISEELLKSTIDINLIGAIRHIQGAARLMQRSTGGSIIAIGSIMGLAGNAGQVPYAAAKAGLVGAIRSASKELGSHGIRANVIAPGFIETNLTSDLTDEVRSERLASIAMGRAGSAEEVAQLVGFMASDMSLYITGQVIGIDGGMIV
jgi:3-oxoacyl-[acyl-carrier protein] reductase